MGWGGTTLGPQAGNPASPLISAIVQGEGGQFSDVTVLWVVDDIMDHRGPCTCALCSSEQGPKKASELSLPFRPESSCCFCLTSRRVDLPSSHLKGRGAF